MTVGGHTSVRIPLRRRGSNEASPQRALAAPWHDPVIELMIHLLYSAVARHLRVRMAHSAFEKTMINGYLIAALRHYFQR